MLRIFLSLLLLGILTAAGGAYFLWQQYESFLKQPLATSASTVFTIQPGSNIRRVAKQLQRQRILPRIELPFIGTKLDSELIFVGHARLEKKAAQIKAGEYALREQMLPDELLNLFISGKTLQYQIGFVEGRRFTDIVTKVKNHPNLEQTLTDADYAELMTKLCLLYTSPSPRDS